MGKGAVAASYAIQRTVNETFESAVERVTATLKDQGYGVLTTIDVKATLKAKIGADVEPQVILGACNPNLAHRALELEPDLGLLLPCNVVVRRSGGKVLVSAIDPASMLGVTGNPALEQIAAEARVRLRAAIEAV